VGVASWDHDRLDVDMNHASPGYAMPPAPPSRSDFRGSEMSLTRLPLSPGLSAVASISVARAEAAAAAASAGASHSRHDTQFDPFGVLPAAVRFIYRERGIASLYEWQHECLRHVHAGDSVLYRCSHCAGLLDCSTDAPPACPRVVARHW
jgi:hypothetical protein